VYVTVGNTPVTTLAALNSTLATLTTTGPATPLTSASFATTGSPSDAEIDQAIADSDAQVYDYVDVQDLIDAANTELARIVADPVGYAPRENNGYWAYIDDGGYGLEDQALKLLVDAAWNLGSARHQTGDARNPPTGATAYVHLYSINRLYAFRDDQPHRGYPCVTVLGQGSVSDGTHVF
jgi:hypothetical protein